MLRLGWALMMSTAVLAGSVASDARATAQRTAEEPVGDWIGTLTIPQGPTLRIAAHISRKDGQLTGVGDSVDQGAFGIPLTNVSSSGGKLSFDVPAGGGHYEGTWDSARKRYVGTWSQTQGSLPLEFSRGKYPPPPPVNWDTPPDPGLTYTPAPAAQPRVGPTLTVGKCINLSNTLEPPTEGAWGGSFDDTDMQIIRDAGFQTVRIPVRWSSHALTSPPYTIDPIFLARVHHVVDLAKAAGLNVMLNMHHYDELFADPSAHRERFAALWRQIAASFASEPKSVWFELLNEPHDKLTDANLQETLAPALAAVRATNPARPVIIGGQNWSGLASLDTVWMPDDPNVVPTFHYYDPFQFTHQGANWMEHAPPFGRVYGTAADKALLDRDLAQVKAYMTRTGRVPILGEYGAQDDPRLPVAQRIRYYHTISSAFASAGIQSCLWGYRSGFAIRQGDHWVPGMVEAIATTTR